MTISLRNSVVHDLGDNAWNDIYLWPFKITKDTTLQWFQTQTNHNILATNNFLQRIKYIKDPMCSFCAKEPENIRRLLWECEHTKKLLSDVKNWCSENNIHIDTEEKKLSYLEVLAEKLAYLNN